MTDLTQKHFAVLGAGNIGNILIERLLHAGVPADSLVIYDSDEKRALAASVKFGVCPVWLPDESICAADVLLVAVPPKVTLEVLHTLAGWLCPKDLVISFAAAVSLKMLEAALPERIPVARVMPNAPSLIGQGMNPVAYGRRITAEGRALTEEILALLGKTVVVHDDQMNGCVGLSGAAMRSVLPALEGMIQAGVEAGLLAEEARRVAAQVMLGTASLALETDLTIEQIKALTPMQTLDEAAVAQIFLEAARSARAKIDALQKKLETA